MTDHCTTDFLHMTDDMLGPSPMHIKYSSYVYDGFCIRRTNFSVPIESVISKFTCSEYHKIGIHSLKVVILEKVVIFIKVVNNVR